MYIKLIRHGESRANTGQLNPIRVNASKLSRKALIMLQKIVFL